MENKISSVLDWWPNKKTLEYFKDCKWLKIIDIIFLTKSYDWYSSMPVKGQIHFKSMVKRISITIGSMGWYRMNMYFVYLFEKDACAPITYMKGFASDSYAPVIYMKGFISTVVTSAVIVFLFLVIYEFRKYCEKSFKIFNYDKEEEED